jgi:GDP-L-fucose synthase
MIQTNIIHSAFISGVKKLLFLGSSCIYPKNASQPIKHEELLNGKLEPTNEPYALAKIAGIKMCESYNRQYSNSYNIDYRSVMPTNLYGPGDNYDLENSHVIPALIRKFYEAKINDKKKVIVWGTGTPKREFLYADDVAKACNFIMNLDKDIFYKNVNPLCSHINLGSGLDITIEELAKIIKNIINYSGNIEFDTEKPDGVKRKILDCKRLLDLGWKPEVSLKQGLVKVFNDFLIKEKPRK